MSIALDNSQFNGFTSVATNRTFSYTCGSGTDFEGLLVVGIGASSGYDASTYAVTYGGVALTFVQNASIGGGTPSDVGVYILKNPTPGAANISVTSTSLEIIGVITESYTGIDQEAPIEATATGTGVSSVINPTVNITTLTNNARVIDFVSASAETTGAMVQGAGQTLIQEGVHNAGLGTSRMGSSYEDKSTAGSVTMSWTLAANFGQWASVVLSLRAAGGRMKFIGVDKIIFS